MITQKEIAEILGISRTTVARAINGSGPIKEETKKKILELAKELKYEKNHIGSILAGKKPKKIYAFIVKSKNKFYTQEIKKGLEIFENENRAYDFKIDFKITDINDPITQIEELKKVLTTQEIDGLIITPLDNKKVYKLIEPYLDRIKVVSLGIKLDKNIYHIGPDHKKQGRIAGTLMLNTLRQGEKLLLIDNGDDKVSSKYYLDGFLEKVKNKNIDILGPIKCNGIEDSIEKLDEILHNEDIRGIYINRYAHDIFDRLDKKLLQNKYIVTNGIGNIIKKLIKNDVILYTVMEEIRDEGYNSGKAMFEILYKNLQLQLNSQVKSRIITKENIE